MKIIIAGKNDIAVDVLDYVIKNNLASEIFVVVNKTEKFRNSFQKSLGFYSKLWNIKIVDLEDVYNIDDVIFLSLEFDQIVKTNLCKTKKLYNIHFSLLPSYRGMYTSTIPILNNEEKTGVTLHEIDDGIDTGNIIDQKSFKIHDNDTARDLYIKYIKYGTELVISNLSNIFSGDFTSHPQLELNVSYYSKSYIDFSNIKIKLNVLAHQLVNQLRAYSFREYQLPKLESFQISSWSITKDKSLISGKVVFDKDKRSAIVSTKDFDVILYFDLYESLWNLCKINNYKFLKKLLANNSLLIDKKNSNGWTALIIAVYNGSYECVEILLHYGADCNACNYNFTNVLMYAKENAIKTKDMKILNLLFEYKINMFSEDIYGKNIFDWVKEEDVNLYKFFKNKI